MKVQTNRLARSQRTVVQMLREAFRVRCVVTFEEHPPCGLPRA